MRRLEVLLIATKVISEELTVINRITWQREKGRGAKTNWKNAMEDIWFAVKDKDNYYFDVDSVKMKRQVIAPYKENGKPKDWEETDEGNFRITFPSNFGMISAFLSGQCRRTLITRPKSPKTDSKTSSCILPSWRYCLGSICRKWNHMCCGKKLGRHYLGIEIDEEYCLWAAKRLTRADKDLEIQGYNGGFFWERNTLNPQKKSTSVKHPRPEEYNQTLFG